MGCVCIKGVCLIHLLTPCYAPQVSEGVLQKSASDQDLFTFYVCYVCYRSRMGHATMNQHVGGGGWVRGSCDNEWPVQCKIDGGLRQCMHEEEEAGDCHTALSRKITTNSCEVEVTHC